jgi:hypothetical protein
MLLDASAQEGLKTRPPYPHSFLFLFLLKRYLWFHEGGVKLVAVEYEILVVR